MTAELQEGKGRGAHDASWSSFGTELKRLLIQASRNRKDQPPESPPPPDRPGAQAAPLIMNIGHADRLAVQKHTQKGAPPPVGSGAPRQAFRPSGLAALWMLGQGRLEVDLSRRRRQLPRRRRRPRPARHGAMAAAFDLAFCTLLPFLRSCKEAPALGPDMGFSDQPQKVLVRGGCDPRCRMPHEAGAPGWPNNYVSSSFPRDHSRASPKTHERGPRGARTRRPTPARNTPTQTDPPPLTRAPRAGACQKRTPPGVSRLASASPPCPSQKEGGRRPEGRRPPREAHAFAGRMARDQSFRPRDAWQRQRRGPAQRCTRRKRQQAQRPCCRPCQRAPSRSCHPGQRRR